MQEHGGSCYGSMTYRAWTFIVSSQHLRSCSEHGHIVGLRFPFVCNAGLFIIGHSVNGWEIAPAGVEF